jgi:hypothetical protein
MTVDGSKMENLYFIIFYNSLLVAVGNFISREIFLLEPKVPILLLNPLCPISSKASSAQGRYPDKPTEHIASLGINFQVFL